MTRSKRTALLALEGVEGLTAFRFQRVGLGLVLAHDEGSGDEAYEEGEEVGNHGLSLVRSSTRTRGPRSAGVCGVAKVTRQ
ncbi:MAG: hypothetical protein AN484_22080 [Aphanizomenon flos-aquae WA102]|uniref:Uncharacterized protein n=1 Tax=Aphanizomenon flos-aquae WA102 TaxID=1710896 RepID=A0A1B7WUP9_APHFL|nr:MAG: hypothetical protein AN484_22080 [Aphanizomenon flos-aquae WA102]